MRFVREAPREINWPLIITFIIVGVVLLIAAIVVLIVFVINPNKLKREIRELDRRFQYLHSLLIGQDAQCIKRLELVSRTNLLYVDIHTRYLKKFKEVRDKHDVRAQSAINTVKDLLDERKFKQIKIALPDTKEIVANYEKEVNNLTSDLLKTIKPEEDCRQASLSLKENLSRIKQEYYANEGDLQLVKESFDVIFNHIASKFTEFENFVESAQYEDANAVLPEIVAILKQVSEALKVLPNLCALVVNIVPEKIRSLRNAYGIMIREEYPLSHLLTESTFNEMEQRVAEYKTKIKQFNLAGVSNDLEGMIAVIDEYFVLFDEEKDAREKFEKDNAEVYRYENGVERRFIKLCNNVPEVARFYIINEEHKAKLDEIQQNVDSMGNYKRILDTFINSRPHQPFSVLSKKLDELKEATTIVDEKMNEFSSYLTSLKNNTQNAYSSITELYFKVKEAEEVLRLIDNEAVSDKYKEPIDQIYHLINQINELLFSSPIDVDLVNEKVYELANLGNTYLGESGYIAQDRNMQLLAENAVVYANRSRADFTDIAQLITQVEKLFKDGEFENAYVVAGTILKKIQSKSDA